MQPRAFEARPAFLTASGIAKVTADAIPIVMVSGMAAAALLLNEFVGLTWSVGLLALAAPSIACFALSWIYVSVRPNPRVAEATLYAGLWLIYPTFGIQLTYLANLLRFPFQDRLFTAGDSALGFSWIDWAHFVSSHPAIETSLRLAYESHYWQPLISIPILAIWGPRGRNAELLTAMLLALIATIIISGLLPAMGPADAYGFKPAYSDAIRALRSGQYHGLSYAGIVSFPSYHTVMAILFTYAHRANRRTFPAVFALNILMLISIPFAGTHYLTDMIGGAFVAIGALLASRRIQLVLSTHTIGYSQKALAA